jgi:hypothetical protein
MFAKNFGKELDKYIAGHSASAMFGPCGPENLRTGPGEKVRTLGLGWILYGFVKAMYPDTILEVGTGGSTFCLAQGLKDNGVGHLHSVDPCLTGVLDEIHRPTDYLTDKLGKPLKHSHANILRQLEFFEFADICTFYHEKSQDLAGRWNEPIDMLVVDGDHTAKGVKADWDNYSKWVKPAGYIFFHDFYACLYEVGSMLEEACSDGSEFSLLVEPLYLSLAIIQKKYHVSGEMFWFMCRLTHKDNSQRMSTPIQMYNMRKIPGMITSWQGRWVETPEVFFKNKQYAEEEAERLIKSGKEQTLDEAQKFFELIRKT